MVNFIISVILLLSTAWFITSRTSRLLSERIWIFIAVISLQFGLIATITSWLNSLTPIGWLVAQGGVTLIILGGMSFVSRNVVASEEEHPPDSSTETTSTLSTSGWLGLLCLLILILFAGIIQFVTPLSYPAYGDERMYHASRVVYWLQNQSLLPYDTHNDRQVVFSFGGEIFFLWPLVFLKSELVGRLIFWLGYPLSASGMYLLGRTLNVSPGRAIITALIFVATPIVTGYATGLKPELWLAFFVLGVAFWLVQSCKNLNKQRYTFFWVGIFLALSINVKFTILPLVLLLGILPWYVHSKENRWTLAVMMGSGLVGGILCSGLAIPLLFNLVNYGHILGPEAMRQVHASEINGLQLYTHAVRLPFLLFELPEVPWVTLQDKLTVVGNEIMYGVGADRLLPLENETTWPGHFTFSLPAYANKFSLGGIVWLPLILAGGLKAVKSGTFRTPLLILSVVDITLLASVVFLVRWMPHSGLPERFLIAPYALGLIIGAVTLNALLDKSKLIRMIALLLVVYTVYPVIRGLSLKAEQAVVSPPSEMLMNMPFTEAMTYISPPATILLLGSQDIPDYPLFAPNDHYSNRVISWGKSTFISERIRSIIDKNQVAYVLVENDQSLNFHWDPPLYTSVIVDWLTQQPDFVEVPLMKKGMRLFENQLMYQKRLEKTELYLQVTQAPQETPIVTVEPSLHNHVGIDPISLSFPRPPEPFGSEKVNIVWLGQGEKNGLHGVLWTRAPVNINLRFDVVSSSDTGNSSRTVYLAGLLEGQLMKLEKTFQGITSINFQVPLRAGPNPFTFFTMNRPTVVIQENGEVRQFPVGIRALVIEPLP